MDADTRHQLKQNELAQALGKIRTLGDRQLIGWIAVLVVIAASYTGYRMYKGGKAAALEGGWAQLANAGSVFNPVNSPEADAQLRALIADQSDPTLLSSARLTLAQTLVRAAYNETQRRELLLKEAEALLRQIIDDPAAPGSVAAAATYAIGSVYESLGQFEQAKASYADLADNARFAGSPFVSIGAERRDSVDELAKTKVVFEPGDPPPPPKPVAPLGPELPFGPTTEPTTQASQPTSADTGDTPPATQPASQPTDPPPPAEQP